MEQLPGFRKHGQVFTKVIGNQAIGDCLFCGKEGKFYANTENSLWDCKRCGLNGNFKTFLAEVFKIYRQNFTEKQLLRLAKNRDLPPEALQPWPFGVTKDNAFCISIDGNDLRTFRLGGKFMSSPSAGAHIFNTKDLEQSKIYICEGEWDAITLKYVLSKLEITDGVVGLPGANTFKKEWGYLFENKDIILLYDNDDAGSSGDAKAREILNAHAKSIKSIKWPENLKKGFDIRDLFIRHKDPKTVYDTIISSLVYELKVDDSKKPIENETSGPIDLDDLFKTYEKWMHLPNRDAISIMFGTILANKLGGDPVWLSLVAPPGGSKSELLMSLSKAGCIYPTTTLSTATFISGIGRVGGDDASLLPKLNNKVLVIKDFTTILSMHYTERDEIFGILRDAYDGEASKTFGTGVKKSYKVRFGVLTGVTPVIEQFNTIHQSLGERFLKFRITGSWDKVSEDAKILRALGNIGFENEMRKEMTDAAARYLNNFKMPETIPTVHESYTKRILNLAKFAARLRGFVSRHDYHNDIILHKPASEVGTRLAKQFQKLGLGIAIFLGKKEWDGEIYRLVRRVALDTVPDRIEDVVRAIYKTDKQKKIDVPTSEIVQETRLPDATIHSVLKDLVLLKIVENVKGVKQGERLSRLTPHIVEYIDKAGIYEWMDTKN